MISIRRYSTTLEVTTDDKNEIQIGFLMTDANDVSLRQSCRAFTNLEMKRVHAKLVRWRCQHFHLHDDNSAKFLNIPMTRTETMV